MYIDKNVVASIQDPGFKHVMSLTLFAAEQASEGLSFRTKCVLETALLGSAFYSSKDCKLARAMKLYKFFRFESTGARVVLYMLPFDGGFERTCFSDGNETSEYVEKTFLIYFSSSMPNNDCKIMCEDFQCLVDDLKSCNEFVNFETELERHKLVNG